MSDTTKNHESDSEELERRPGGVTTQSARLQFIQSFLDRLDANTIWHVVLRNHHSIADETENDIDLMASAQDFETIQRLFATACEEHSFVKNGSRIRGKSLFMGATPRGTSTERPVALHFVCFVSAHRNSLQRRVRGLAQRIRVPEVARERLKVQDYEYWAPTAPVRVLFLFAKLFHKPKQKYVTEIHQLLESDSCSGLTDHSDALKAAASVESAPALRSLAIRTLASKVLSPIGLTYRFMEWNALAIGNLRSRFRKRGLLIFFSGPDGAGKSTTTANTVAFLENKAQVPVLSFRGLNPLNEKKKLGAVLTEAQYKLRGVSNATPVELETNLRDRRPGHGDLRWKLRRLMGLLFILGQYHASYLIARLRNLRGTTVVIDTAVYDRFVKSHRPRFRWLERFTVPLLPSGDVVFRLYADPEVIYARKPELNLNELTGYYTAMDEIYHLKSKSNIRSVITENGPDAAAKEIGDELSRLMNAA